MKKKQEKRNMPKNNELVSVLATRLEEMKVGESRNMTPLAKEIDLDGSYPHVDTIRNKLTEGFIFRDILKNFKPTYEEGKLIRIEKVEDESKQDVLIPMIENITIEMGKIKEDIKNLNLKK